MTEYTSSLMMKSKRTLTLLGSVAAIASIATVALALHEGMPRSAGASTKVTALLAEGKVDSALIGLAEGLADSPDSADLNALAGLIALRSGDYPTAVLEFDRAIAASPNEPLALYGAALSRMAYGDLLGALKRFNQAAAKGLADGLRSEWIAAFTSAPAAGDGSSMAVFAHFLKGRANRAALKEIFTETPIAGLACTGDPKRPFAPTLQKRNLIALTKRPTTNAISGEIVLKPSIATGYPYIGYDIDGQSIGLLSTAPFEATWNSQSVSNGAHEVVTTYYDSNATERRRETKKIYVRNSVASTGLSEAVQEALKAGLSLTPEPEKVALAVATSEERAGDRKSAALWRWKAIALHPSSEDGFSALRASAALPTPVEPLYSGRAGEKIVAFTFDDGPKPGMTESLLDLLVREKVPSTFFVIGRHVDANPDLARKIVGAGMELANHSYTHRNLTKMSDAEASEEMSRTQAAIFRATGKAPEWMRPPGGNWNGKVAASVRKWGLTPCFWTVDVYGSEVVGTQQVAQQTLSQVHPGSIILMHNGKMSTLQALPAIIRELKRRGYGFVTISELHRRLKSAPASERVAVSKAGAKRRSE